MGPIPGWGRTPGGGHWTHSSILAWRIPWTKDPGGLQSLRSKRIRHNQVTQHTRNSHYWSNCLEYSNWPWSTEWSRAKANRVLPGERTGHCKHPLPTTQEKILHMDITRWPIPKSDWLYSLQPKMEKLYTVSKKRLGADCGSHHEVLIVKFRLKMKKVGKNHWTIQVWPKSNPLWLYSGSDKKIQGIRSDGQSAWWTIAEVQEIVQETGIKTISKKRKCKKAKWLSEEALQMAVKWREVKSKGEKERYTHFNVEFQRIARRNNRAFLTNQCKEIEENNIIGKARDHFKKIRDTKGEFHTKMGSKRTEIVWA